MEIVLERGVVPLAYVAGAYTGDTPFQIDHHIQGAEHVAQLVCKRGWYALTPHKNSAQFERMVPNLSAEFWLKGTMEMMERCKAVVLVPGWQASKGTLAEVRRATELGIPVFQDPMLLPLTEFSIWAPHNDPAKAAIEEFGLTYR